MRKYGFSARDRKHLSKKRKWIKHGEGKRIPSFNPSKEYLKKVLKIRKK